MTEKKKNSAQLIQLYQQMYELTNPVCGGYCRVPHSCCSPEYCDVVKEYAQNEWGVTLTPADPPHERLMFMGPTGCIVPPHLRPLCTMHVCCINSLGFKPDDPQWTKKYFALRRKIDRLEF